MTSAHVTKPAVLIVVPTIKPEGISKVALTQLQALLEKDYPVKLLVLSNVDEDVLKAFAPGLQSDQVTELHEQETYLSVKALKRAFVTADRVRKVVVGFRPEITFAHAPYAQFILRLAKFWPGLPPMQLWAYFHFSQYQEFPLNSFRRETINLLNRWLAKRFDAGHISVSETVKEDISKHLIRLQNHKVIYNALPTTQTIVLPEVKRDIFIIVVPGRLEIIKGQLWFLEVFKQFLHRVPDREIKLLLVGDGSKYNEIQELIQTLEIEDTVELTGHLPNSLMLTRFREADLVVLPSFMEGLPLVLLEALQQNALVLASDIQPNKEVLISEDLGILFKVGNAEDCLEKLLYIYNNRNEQIVDFSAIATHLRNNFSFEKHMQQLISVIENSK